ncbi:amidohydrolase family protein [Pseudomonas atacamensis]|uniref:amidohydrolase family protein n=1 Tax=Pseudomonas atacamensis TaxID=2565368 RepID=UPI001FAD3B32|nr:amidohydrolase family protein [Pseudomonas atacamensis]MCI9877241.1 amidohydrolase family protein [Pseudomonas atacamensis]
MLPSIERTDSHVHFFTSQDLRRVSAALPYTLPAPHSLTAYLDNLMDAGMAPTLINNVHLSILPDSENVFASFDELHKLKAANPQRYGSVRLVGTIKADPAYASNERLSHPQVIGARIVLHDARPESVSPTQFSDEQWQAFYQRLQSHQHLHIYAKEAETNLRVLRQIPCDVRVFIDHLGTCHPERGITEPAWIALLADASARGNVWFKGPGYRTSSHPEEAARFVTQIVRTVGADRILLEATDAPHVGTDNEGVKYSALFDPNKAFNFVDAVARHVSQASEIPVGQLLRGASGQLAS